MLNIVWWKFNMQQLRGLQPSALQGVHATPMYMEMFSKMECTHHEDFSTLSDGALVIINAGNWSSDYLDTLNQHLDKLPWSIVFVIFNEDEHLDVRRIRCTRLWAQEAKPGIHDSALRLPIGQSSRVKFIKDTPRVNDWFFSGRLYHLLNWQTAIRTVMLNGLLREATIDSQGLTLTYQSDEVEYIHGLCASKVAVCRPGNCTPETPRIYEAIEAGCVPIVPRFPPDGHWKQHYGTYDYWEYLLGEKPPFPIIDRPEDLAAAIQDALNGWPDNAKHISQWWTSYKQRTEQIIKNELRGFNASSAQ